MAEIWPMMKTKLLSGDRKSRKSGRRIKSRKANPFSSPGLEKFAALLEEIQARKGASLVEHTASSLCAARSISRSAQEWTAATLVRSAGPCSSETKFAAFEALAPTKVENLERDHVKNSSRDHAESLSEERQVQEASSESRLVGIRSLPERRAASSRRQVRSSKSKSVFVVLLAMGTFLSTLFKPLAAVLTFRAVIQVWQKGKLSARLMFSSAALYFLNPLRSYLVTHMPARLNILPQNPEPQNAEIVISQPDPTLEVPAESAVEESAPSPVLLPIPEISSSVSMTVTPGASSKSRRLAKKIASRLKKLKMFRSSSSSIEGSLHDSTVSEPSSPDRHRMCPFSKRSRSLNTELEGLSSSRKCIVMRRQRSSDSMVCKKSRLGRRLSSETLEEYNLLECSSASSSLHGKEPFSSELEVGNATSSSSRDEVFWPVVGLLITLLFLLVGRFPAIMATSLFFVVVSHDRGHSRSRDNSRALEAARKLQRSPQRWTSPLRK